MMKIKTNQKGFSTLETVLILVVVGLIGFTGWYVWNTKKETDKDLKATSTNEVKKDNLPAGWTVYENEEVGFKLNHPKSWGSVKQVVPGDDLIANEKSLLFSGVFDKEKRVSFGVGPKDYEFESLGDPLCVENGFSEFKYFEDADFNTDRRTTEEILKTKDTHVIEIYANGYCARAMLKARVSLNLNESNGIDITYFKEAQYEEALTIKEFVTKNSIPVSVKSDFLKVVKSVQEI